MARNGSGTYSRAVSPYVYNTVISQDDVNAEMNDIAAALTASIAKDGQTVPTANLPMGTYRHTGVGNGSARTDYAAMGQVQDGKVNWVDGGGTADAITATYSPSITALVDGQLCHVRATAANATTTPTFAPNGLTARTIVKNGGVALVAGGIVGDGHELILRYDLTNTRWELLNPSVTLTALGAPTKGGIQAQTYTAYTTGGTSTAYTLTPTPALSALAENQEFDVEFHTAAGATPTLAISGLTAKSLKYRNSAGTLVAVTSTQIPSGWRSRVTYDGTDYIVREVPVVLSTITQVVEATPIATVVSCSTVIPLDNSIPQNTEGNEVITVAITPTNASNRLRIEFDASQVGLSAGVYPVCALFQDSTAGALAAGAGFPVSGGTNGSMLRLSYEMAAGTTSATTFKVRVGPSSAATVYVNGDSAGTRVFGGVAAASLRVTEIKV